MYDDVALDFASRHNGVIHTEHLRRLGVTPWELDQLRGSRHWEWPTSAVGVREGSAPTDARRLTIATFAAGPDAALSHLPAAGHWGLSGCPTRRPVAVRVGSVRTAPREVRIRLVRTLPDHWTTELDGVPIVRPELCALQLFADCRPDRAARLVDRLWSLRLLSGPSLRRFISEMGRSGRNGTAGVRLYLDDRADDYTPPASGLESRVMEILLGAGIRVRRQVDAGSESRWTGRVDFVVEGTSVVIEVQSEAYHAALTDRQADATRRAELEAAGWTWVEVWDRDVWASPAAVVDAVLDGLRRAGAVNIATLPAL